MDKYYTRACNFYYGKKSKEKLKLKNALPLGENNFISFDKWEIICRYKTLSGFRDERKAGWDTHGITVELTDEKDLKLGLTDWEWKIQVYKIGGKKWHKKKRRKRYL